jgi:TetR/AcrR family transcriptional repressor of mexJK operon
MSREPKESIREKILLAAERRFWHFGIKKTTIDEIAADAEVGKGTVYLHFESKEEIALDIITHYKEMILVEQQAAAKDIRHAVLDRMKRVLTLPVMSAHERCRKSPTVMEMIQAIKPQMSQRIRDLFDREVELIASLIEEANQSGEMHVDRPAEAAHIIKIATLNFLPHSPACAMIDDPMIEIANMVDLVFRGLR